MAGKPRIPKEVTLENERRAWALRQKMWTHERIAQELGLERTTVTMMLKRIGNRHLKTIQDEVASIRAEQLDQLSYIADEAMQAWESSKAPSKSASKTSKKRTSGGAGDDETRVETKERDGNPAYFTAAMKALEDIRKLLGLDAPIKVAPTNPAGDKPYSLARIQGMDDNEIETRIAGLVAGAAGGIAIPARGTESPDNIAGDSTPDVDA